MRMFEKYCSRTEFTSYEDFRSGFSVQVPDKFNFAYDVVDKIAGQEPEKLAMLWCNPAGVVKKFTFADMSRESSKAANLFTRLGIKKGDKVMLILKRHYEFWFCILGLHKIGAVALPATHLLTVKDLAYRNQAADVKMIVCTSDGTITQAVDESQPLSPSLKKKVIVRSHREGWANFEEEMAKSSETFPRPSGGEDTVNDDMMLLYFTSGTTGMPKMVAHNFAYPLGHIVTAAYWQNVQDNGLHLTVSDTGWAKSVWGKIYGQWLAGSAIFTYDFDKFDAKDLLEKITTHKVTTFCAPPTIYRFFIKEDLSQYDFTAMKYAVTAGEALNPEVQAQFKAATGLTIREAYGQTEMTVSVGTFPWMESKPGSMGRPSPGYDMVLMKEDGTICHTGESGEIVMYTDKCPPGMFNGYYESPETTERVWRDGIYHTGDVAWQDEDGYFWYVGRTDDVIKSSGYRIGPFEVESALLEHPAVLEAAVTGVPHPVRGQVVKATVILARGYSASEELKSELQEHVKKTTAPYKYPRIIEFVTELPKTISGKIRRVEIREKDSGKEVEASAD